MSISKPYYRIARPSAFIPDYVMDSRYASDRMQLSRSYIHIERELREIFNYIEPDEQNKNVFSLELYSILLRACTEVELNCSLIMKSNGATPSGTTFTMSDYKKIENSSKLSKYRVSYKNWRNRDSSGNLIYETKEITPFANFALSTPCAPQWYKDYNAVKHYREENMEKASLENCLSAVAGILVLLYSQFGSLCIETYGTNDIYFQHMDNYDFHFNADVIFGIIPPNPNDWSPDDLYAFDWNSLKTTDSPFDRFSF